jgi:parvulin-like peptidyl-prolyl isomerase
MLGGSYGGLSLQDVGATFGPGFARSLFGLEPDGWSGPIASAYGWHLVRIEARSSSRLPTLAEVADQVRRDWSEQQRQDANEAVFERLLARYEVVIKDVLEAGPPGPDAGGRR